MPLMYENAGWQEAYEPKEPEGADDGQKNCSQRPEEDSVTSNLRTGNKRSLASPTQTSSSLASTINKISSSSLTMSENFQNPPLLGTSKSLQLSLPVGSPAASLTGRVCSLPRVSAPAVTSAWLLPSVSGTSFQPLMGSAYLYQHSSTTMLSGVPGQSHISTPAASNPGIFEWALTGGTEKKSSSIRDFTVTVIDQDTAVSSMSMASHYNKTSDATNMVPLYPSLSASLVHGASSQIPNQGQSLSLPYQEGSQLYYYNQGTLGPLLSAERGPYLQSYGSVSYTESRASAPQPEMVMVLKEVQPTHMIPPASTSAIYYSVPAQPITDTRFQVMETSLGMKTSLGLTPLSQTFCPSQNPEIPKSCGGSNIQLPDSNPPPELGDISMAGPVQSPSIYLALPPAPSQEQKENRNLQDVKTMLSKPLDAYQIPTENQDPPLLPLEIPAIAQVLACFDPLGQEEQPGCENAGLGKNSLSLKDQGTLENGTESNDGFADIATLVEDIHLPVVLNPLDELDQSQGPKVIQTKDTRAINLNEVQKTSVINAPSDQARKNKHDTSELINGDPIVKIQPESPDGMFVGEVAVSNAAASDRGRENRAKNSNKPQKAAPSRTSKSKSHGQEKAKRTRENNPKKTEERKQSGNKVKAEEKPNIPKMKRKKYHAELTQETFKKPRTSLGMHMLESVQVFHALGKKSDKKTELSSSRALGHSNNPKGPQPSLAIRHCLDTPREGKGPERAPVKRRKPDGSADKDCSSPSEYELPPPGKVKLVPLIFPTLDKPQARPVPRRPLSLASRRPAGANRAQPGSKSAQPTAVNSSQPTSASMMGPARPALPISTNPDQPGWTNPTQPSVPQCDASRPVPYKTSTCTSFQREPVRTMVNKPRTPPKPQNQWLLQDLAYQRIPWRIPDMSGPVMSTPITKEQRPEREAMKRKAQLERENAAKFTSLGKVQYFIEREKEMEISRYYGYAK
ncbi:uncharacterized protein C2orf78 homolog [Myotis daubentonii]|uniref:uncharacterized protein C2orf78 homolog n=1 Tax=Myotis daubentonii TaxID=98922 RepID=UPI002873A88A|nr:uncharacterized protein C2orf78 homolog [Myotis daubentonii]